MVRYSGDAPVVGARVMTSDGRLLGKVAELGDGCFKVDAPVQQDYWLSNRCITGTGGGDIHVDFPHHELHDVLFHERPDGG